MKKLIFPFFLALLIAGCTDDSILSVQEDAYSTRYAVSMDSISSDSIVSDSVLILDSVCVDSTKFRPHHRKGHFGDIKSQMDSLRILFRDSATHDSIKLVLDSIKSTYKFQRDSFKLTRDSLKMTRDSLRLVGDSTRTKFRPGHKDMHRPGRK